MKEQTKDSFTNTGNALARLREALAESGAVEDTLKIDGTIQRFEFCIELMWKLFQRLLLSEGQDIQPLPKPIMQKAYAVGWIDDEKLWLGMLDDRNKTSHTYQQALAREIYSRIRQYYPVLQATYDKLVANYRP